MTLFRWNDENDWDNSQSSDGVVAEDIGETDNDNENEVKRGYSIDTPYPSRPFIYWPMHEDSGDRASDFGKANENGYAKKGTVEPNREGLLTTTSFKFNSSSYVSAGNVLVDTFGGDIFDKTIDGVDYRIHRFTSVGTNTFTVDKIEDKFDIMLVGGGGGTTSNDGSGGAGAGGLVYAENVPLKGDYTITIGDGGPGDDSADDGGAGPNGEDTTFGSLLTALGGGGGGNKNGHGADGGSGGGIGQNSGNYGYSIQEDTNSLTEGTVVYDAGHRGSNSRGRNTGGGGGGAGDRGGYTGDNSDGGIGLDMSSYFTTDFGENGYFAGGGGGGENGGGGGLDGGLGGGADGSTGSYTNDGTDGTGGGAGGSGNDHPTGGSGGSGIVLIRLKKSE